MDDFPLSGAQRTHLRGLGQRLEPVLKLGRDGLTPPVVAAIDRLLAARELIKLRFLNADRDARAELAQQIETAARCVCVGAVGHTALFYRPIPDATARHIQLPS